MSQKIRPLSTDLIELSDLFRRMARFKDQQAATELVSLARHLGAALTYICHEYDMDHGMNRQVLSGIKEVLEKMDIVAVKAGLTELTLPLHQDHPDAEIIRNHVLPLTNITIQFGFRSTDYNQDLDQAGPIERDIRTFLDKGIRGLGAIETATKYKWDRDNGGQLGLGL